MIHRKQPALLYPSDAMSGRLPIIPTDLSLRLHKQSRSLAG
ncbi:MAG: hypothetical protein U7123_14690 [Potamolinea sp.]